MVAEAGYFETLIVQWGMALIQTFKKTASNALTVLKNVLKEMCLESLKPMQVFYSKEE